MRNTLFGTDRPFSVDLFFEDSYYDPQAYYLIRYRGFFTSVNVFRRLHDPACVNQMIDGTVTEHELRTGTRMAFLEELQFYCKGVRYIVAPLLAEAFPVGHLYALYSAFTRPQREIWNTYGIFLITNAELQLLLGAYGFVAHNKQNDDLKAVDYDIAQLDAAYELMKRDQEFRPFVVDSTHNRNITFAGPIFFVAIVT